MVRSSKIVHRGAGRRYIVLFESSAYWEVA